LAQEEVNYDPNMSQKWKLLEKIDYEHIIEEFISKNTQRMTSSSEDHAKKS